MKKVFLISILILSASAFANICEVQLVDRYNRVLHTFRASGGPNDCMEAMKQCRFEQRVRDLRHTTDCVRVGSSYPDPTPAPTPSPYPRPVPTPNYYVTAVGLLNETPFKFEGRDPNDLYQNCLRDVRSVRSSGVDEILMSVNNNTFKASKTSGWFDDQEICSMIHNEARMNGIGYMRPTRIYGTVEYTQFDLYAQDRESLLMNCLSEMTNLRVGSSDEMNFSVNGLPMRRVTTSGWWSSPAEVCQALVISAEPQL